ncbi:MAG TPA: alkaline phosphatase family protein, partial [Vicinamibacteria bacterium]
MTGRVVASAALAAALLAGDLVLLATFLNPEASFRRDGLALAIALFAPYAAAGTAALWLLAMLARAAWRRAPARPPLEALPWFTTLALVAVSAAAALFWWNLVGYRYSIPLTFLRALLGSAIGLTAAVLVLAVVVADALLFPRRGRGFSAALVVLASAAALVLPLALRPAPAPAPRPVRLNVEQVRPARRVILVGVDGLGPDFLREALAGGRLPVFGRIVRHGGYGPLATIRPTEGPPVWTTIVTGRLPRDHGVKSFSAYRLRGSASVYELLPRGAFVGALERAGLVTRVPLTSSSRRRHALWNALNAFGAGTGVVRFWGTYPVERVQGFMVSNYFHLLAHDETRVRDTVHPPDLLAEVRARVVDPAELPPGLVSEFVDPKAPPDDARPWRTELLERALAPDMTYQRAGAVLRAAYDPPFFATYFYGLDVVGHAFLRYARPEQFGNVGAADVRRYGRVVDRYAEQIAQWVGELLQGQRPGEVLIVVSGYGMESQPLWRRLLGGLLGAAPPSGTHGGAPDGCLLAMGDGVRPGSLVSGASILDVAPTVLYLMGLPVARDMEGRVLTEILEEGFVRTHPLTYIPSYENLGRVEVAPASDTGLPPLPEEVP